MKPSNSFFYRQMCLSNINVNVDHFLTFCILICKLQEANPSHEQLGEIHGAKSLKSDCRKLPKSRLPWGFSCKHHHVNTHCHYDIFWANFYRLCPKFTSLCQKVFIVQLQVCNDTEAPWTQHLLYLIRWIVAFTILAILCRCILSDFWFMQEIRKQERLASRV